MLKIKNKNSLPNGSVKSALRISLLTLAASISFMSVSSVSCSAILQKEGGTSQSIGGGGSPLIQSNDVQGQGDQNTKITLDSLRKDVTTGKNKDLKDSKKFKYIADNISKVERSDKSTINDKSDANDIFGYVKGFLEEINLIASMIESFKGNWNRTKALKKLSTFFDEFSTAFDKFNKLEDGKKEDVSNDVDNFTGLKRGITEQIGKILASFDKGWFGNIFRWHVLRKYFKDIAKYLIAGTEVSNELLANMIHGVKVNNMFGSIKLIINQLTGIKSSMDSAAAGKITWNLDSAKLTEEIEKAIEEKSKDEDKVKDDQEEQLTKGGTEQNNSETKDKSKKQADNKKDAKLTDKVKENIKAFIEKFNKKIAGGNSSKSKTGQ